LPETTIQEIVGKSFFFTKFNSLGTKELYSVFRTHSLLSVGGAWRMSCHLLQWNYDPAIVETEAKTALCDRFRDLQGGKW
jgi:hypothetical protein